MGRSPKAGRRDASPRIHPRHGCRACMHKGFARTQSQPSIHSLSWGKGAVRHGCRNKDTPSFKHGCLQVVEQSRCRTHRQQTTTIAERQSHRSVLKGIGIINQKFISKTDFFSKLNLYISVCRKTNIFLKWGLGRSPKQGEGGSPTLTLFLGKGGSSAWMPKLGHTKLCTRQSHQSVLKGIGIINQKFISKTDFFSKLNLYIYNNRKSYTIQPFCVYCTNYYFKSRE